MASTWGQRGHSQEYGRHASQAGVPMGLTDSSGSSASFPSMYTDSSETSAGYDGYMTFSTLSNDPAPSYDSAFEASTSYDIARSNVYSSERHTPSSLGWFTETDLVNLYDLIVVKGKEPYLQLLPRWTPTRHTPQMVYLDSPSSLQKGVYSCQFPSSCRKTFNRSADLDRHYKNVHASVQERNTFSCDYPKCVRSKEGSCFTRKDHYRDHLRDYHKEDIGTVKGLSNTDRPGWEKAQKLWLTERKIDSSWWRCSKCLARVYITKGSNAWECEKCKVPCEEERRERRTKTEPVDETYPPGCASCLGSGWIQNMNGEWESCFECQDQPYQQSYSNSYYENGTYFEPSTPIKNDPHVEWPKDPIPQRPRNFSGHNMTHSSSLPLPGESSTVAAQTKQPGLSLDPRYVVAEKPSRFFAIGRVFKTLWTAPAGEVPTDAINLSYNDVGYGQASFTKIRRFVVIRKRLHSSICLPISTYSGRGSAKKDVRTEDLAAVYQSGEAYAEPSALNEFLFAPFPVLIEEPGEKLDPKSYLNFGHVYTVEHNLKVLRVGRIESQHIARLKECFNRAMAFNEPDENS